MSAEPRDARPRLPEHRDRQRDRTAGSRAVVALLWANSPWSDSYESLWTTKLAIRIGDGGISADLRHWVNEGLMTFFFLVVGLEAKRELDMGELRERRRLAIPVLAAIGGMTVPIAIYLAFNAGALADSRGLSCPRQRPFPAKRSIGRMARA